MTFDVVVDVVVDVDVDTVSKARTASMLAFDLELFCGVHSIGRYDVENMMIMYAVIARISDGEDFE